MVRLAPILSPEAESRLDFMSPDQRMASSHLACPGGRVLTGADGVLTLGEQLPLLSGLVALIRMIPGHLLVAEPVYRWVARNRYRLGGGCPVRA